MSNSTLTTNFNALKPTGFRLAIDSTKYANVEYFLTEVQLPELSQGEVSTTYRGKMGFVPGDRIEYGTLPCRFIVDEDLKNYLEIYNWMLANVGNQTNQISDMILTIMTSHGNAGKEFRFRSAFPIALSGVTFTTQNTDVEELQSSVTFRYDRFEIA